MGALNGYDDEGVLTINSVLMNGPAWAVGADEGGENGLLQLWMSAEKRGSDRILPSATGVIPYKKRRTGTPYTLNIRMTGDVNQSGVPYSNSQSGLVTNLKVIRDSVIDAGDANANGLVAATLVMWGSSFSASIHVVRLIPNGAYPVRTHESLFQGLLEIDVPAGRFA